MAGYQWPFLGPSYIISHPTFPCTSYHPYVMCASLAHVMLLCILQSNSPPCGGRVIDLTKLNCWALLLWFLVPKSLSQLQINFTACEHPEWSWYTSCHFAFQKGRASLYLHYWISTEYKYRKKSHFNFYNFNIFKIFFSYMFSVGSLENTQNAIFFSLLFPLSLCF